MSASDNRRRRKEEITCSSALTFTHLPQSTLRSLFPIDLHSSSFFLLHLRLLVSLPSLYINMLDSNPFI